MFNAPKLLENQDLKGIVRKPDTLDFGPSPSAQNAMTFAQLVSSGLGIPERQEDIFRRFKETGNIREWEEARVLWKHTRDKDLRRKIVAGTINRAKTIGVDPAIELQGGGLGILESETREVETSLSAAKLSPEKDIFANRELNNFVNEGNIEDGYQILSSIFGLMKEQKDNDRRILEELNEIQKIWSGRQGTTEGGLGEWAGFLGKELFPAVWLADRIALANAFPEVEDAMSPLAGNIIRAFREHVVKLSSKDRRVFAEKLIRYVWEERTTSGISDMSNFSLVQSIVNDKTFIQNNSENDFEDTLENIFSIFEVFYVGGLVRRYWGLIRKTTSDLNVGTRVQTTANPSNYNRAAADIVLNLNNVEALKKYNIGKVDIARAQLPGLARAETHIYDIPSNTQSEVDRVSALQAEAMLSSRSMDEGVYRVSDVVSATERELKNLEETVGGRLRPSLSRVSVHSDARGVRFNTVIGRNDTHGFGSEKSVFEEAEQLLMQGYEVKIYRSVDGVLEPYHLTAKEAVEDLAKIRNKTRKSERGNFYVEFSHDYFIRPTDRGLFGDGISVTPEWMGRSARWALTPSAHLGKEIYEPFLVNTLKAQSLAGTLESIVAPIFKMKNSAQRNINRMYSFSEDFVKHNNRQPKKKDYYEAFPDATNDEFYGLSLTKSFNDTLYDINNERLYRDWSSQGFKTIRGRDTKAMWHGKPLGREQLSGKFDGTGYIQLYNPATGKIERLSTKDLDDLYVKGGQILKTEQDITVGSKSYSNLVLHTPDNKGFILTKLSSFPLKYLDWYTPRMYKDPYYIEKIIKNATVNGVKTEKRQVVKVAATKKQAEKYAARLSSKDTSVEYKVMDDFRLSEKDTTARDRELMQVEGRLFFDERAQQRLYNIDDTIAEIYSPIEMITRSSQMLARQTSTEELVKSMKTSWGESFGKEFAINIDTMANSAVRGQLNEVIKSGSREAKTKAIQAKEVWDYINLMEGITSAGSRGFRRAAIDASEYLLNTFGPNRVTKYLGRKAEKISPIEGLKSLAFLDFIVSRPARQLILQGSQHMFLGALDPAYIGRWQLHSTLLLQGAKRRGAELMAGKKVTSAMLQRNAKLMGLTEKEYGILLKEFDNSGIVQAINIHSFAGDQRALRDLPTDKFGDVLQKISRTATAAPVRETAQKVGFDLGEQYNVSASYMMALRQYRKEKGIKNLEHMVADDWRAVTAKASNYALAMNRANSAKFQYGPISVTAQFLSFTHKTFLTMVRAGLRPIGGQYIPGLRKLDKAIQKVGNKAFTPEEASRLVWGQMLMFGGAGFGMKPEVEKLLSNSGLDKYIGTEFADILEGGMLDWVLDNSLQFVLQDPDLDFAFDEFLAPGANVINVARTFVDAFVEVPLEESLFGPSGATTSRLYKAGLLARQAVGVADDPFSPDIAMTVIDEISRGFLSGYDDFAKARIATGIGHFMASDGTHYEWEAKWTDIIAKGLLGLNRENHNTAWRTAVDIRDIEKHLDNAATEHYKRAQRLITELVQGKYSWERTSQLLEQERWVIAKFPIEEQDYIRRKWRELDRNARLERKSTNDLIVSAVFEKNLPVEQYLIDVFLDMGGSPEDAEALRKGIEENFRRAQTVSQTHSQLIQDELDQIKKEKASGN